MSRRSHRTQRAYMAEEWFHLLEYEIGATSASDVARRLGVSASAVSQVANGAGLYGTGGAGTARFGRRVSTMLTAAIECPFLTAFAGEPKRISGKQCRDYAYREPPTNNPHEGRHWRACRTCELRVEAPRRWDEAGARFVLPIDTSRLARGRPKASTQPTGGVAAPAAVSPAAPTTLKEAA